GEGRLEVVQRIEHVGYDVRLGGIREQLLRRLPRLTRVHLVRTRYQLFRNVAEPLVKPVCLLPSATGHHALVVRNHVLQFVHKSGGNTLPDVVRRLPAAAGNPVRIGHGRVEDLGGIGVGERGQYEVASPEVAVHVAGDLAIGEWRETVHFGRKQYDYTTILVHVGGRAEHVRRGLVEPRVEELAQSLVIRIVEPVRRGSVVFVQQHTLATITKARRNAAESLGHIQRFQDVELL